VPARIDAAAITHNARTIAGRIAPAQLMGIVKADAYGHGLAQVVPALLDAGVTSFGVATVAEALQLHAVLAGSAHDDCRIVCWLYDNQADLTPLVQLGIEIALPNPGALTQLTHAAERAGRPALVHLKIDTGLGRSGLTPQQLEALLPDLATARGITIVGAMTHFACADEPEDPANDEQREVFATALTVIRQLLDDYPELGDAGSLSIHAANSPAALSMSPVPGTAARVGLSLYGLSPFEGTTGADLGLRPALQLVSHVITVKDVPAGQGASYGLTYRTQSASRFALVAGGYGDGLPRAASGQAQVTIGGSRYPIVGRIAMDQMVADIGPAGPGSPAITAGDEVVIIGDGTTGPSAEEWGAWSDSLNYEVVTRIGARVDRIGCGDDN